ncbi:MAG TPA: hypothetical protein DEF43_07540 [Chloroflexus aurantiacus]|jgi:hypothetical protein|uniref:Uncharacterized protein n=1 Tax=Chloroflexus aurantiacus (strain ATCC 29366 / DSM 635 / J-10-fl) TaxID=324602 RepID=A9WAS8_CHLAA|nr:hypothetical protein [Chloroflexus aurantiacus]ABY33306.1 conserved hypothetical protein [Chloroflexus aurantiacus J-10-fl]RMG51256.1 MAG: hypothetical protein D6716_06415 [Chloroflexota bacterium]HBW67008.1 hypothetical protein [Chloroflexus aurantiacus]
MEGTTNPTTAPTAQLAPAEAIDPRPLDTAGMEECSIISDSDLESIVNSVPIYSQPTYAEYGTLGCTYTFEGDKDVSIRIELDSPGRQVYDSVMQYVDVSADAEPVNIGDIAVIKEKDGLVSLDAVLNGWYVSLSTRGFPRASALTLAQWLTGRLIPRPDDIVAEQPTATAPGPVSGSLIDMQVTIESPAEAAGVTTLAEIKAIGFMGFSMCSRPYNVPFIVAFNAPPGTQPPTPVGVFSITAEAGVTPGQPSPATIIIGIGPSDAAEETLWQGTIVVAADGTSGTFEVPGQVKVPGRACLRRERGTTISVILVWRGIEA